jgi:hypothetical protein
MITWQQEWRAISDRIKGIESAAAFLFRTLPEADGDLYDAGDKFILPNALSVITELKSYRAAHSKALPAPASDALDRFLDNINVMLTGVPAKGLVGVQGTVTALVSFEAEFSHLLSDRDSIARRLTERAFIHLQRLIIVDADVEAKWTRAFAQGETECERLGAVHLLNHGIWAFKASAEGARTDLILGEPLTITAQLREASEALVLTEWKLVNAQADVAAKARQALAQASQYSVGIMAGFELSTVRYLVLVSKDSVVMPADFTDRDATYRHINIATSPSVPSKNTVVR